MSRTTGDGSPRYCVRLNNEEIAATALEYGDPSMGTVIGKIVFHMSASPFSLLFDYCRDHGVALNGVDLEIEFIDTPILADLRVYRADGVEVKGIGCCVCGFKDDGYEISILGIPYPFYGEEFPQHCSTYNRKSDA